MTSTDGGIDCGAACASHYPEGEVATLSAIAVQGSVFAGWIGGSCFGTGACVATLDGDTTVTAVFATGALPPPFTDEPLVPRITAVRAVHVSELRARIEELRSRHGLVAYSWTDPHLVPGATTIKAVHLLELREALAEVFAQAGSSPPFSAALVVAGATVITAKDIAELRTAVLAVW